MKTVAIIDYGMGNLHSARKAVEHVAPDCTVLVTDDAAKIREADRVILPGVGAIRDCMAEMHRLGVVELVKDVSQDRPFLGICVGMQALMARSEENGGVEGIGLFPSEVRYFGDNLTENGERLKVPHMGWNQVYQTRTTRSGTTSRTATASTLYTATTPKPKATSTWPAALIMVSTWRQR